MAGVEENAERLGKYTLLGIIGEGGMARVYRAVLEGPLGFRKEVALKRIRDELVESNPILRNALINEARLGGYLRHPNVVETYEFHEIGSSFVIAMEFVDGLPLDAMVDGCRARETQMPLSAVLDTIDQVCAGLAYAHTVADATGTPLDIVHRDMKPANVIVTKTGIAKVTDFGIAMAAGRLGDTTVTGMTKGTPYYMSPEQIEGDRTIDGRSDVFAVGAILYELCVGERLFTGKDLTSVFYRIVTGKRDEYMARLDERLKGLGAVVEKCLEPRREDRYPDVDAFQAALRAVRAREAVQGLGLKDCVAGLIASADDATRDDPTRNDDFASLLERGAGLDASTGWPAFVEALQSDPKTPDPIQLARETRSITGSSPVGGARGMEPTATVDVAGSGALDGGPGRTKPMGSSPSPRGPGALGSRGRAATVGALALGCAALVFFAWPTTSDAPITGAPPPGERAAEGTVAAPLPDLGMDLGAAPEPSPPADVAHRPAEAAPPATATPEPPRSEQAGTRAVSSRVQETPTRAIAPKDDPATPAAPAAEPIREAPVVAEANAVLVPFVLNTLPWATVTQGGQSLGRTPYESKLPAGTHRFVATSPSSGESHEFTLHLDAARADKPLRRCWDFRSGEECRR